MKSFAETLKEIRESRGLLLREVAAGLRVDPSFLSRVESGVKKPTRDQVVELAAILGVDRSELLIHYLSDRVLYELKDESALAMEVIMAAERRIRYERKEQVPRRSPSRNKR